MPDKTPELNADGFVPGQTVSFEEIKAAEYARRQKPAEDAGSAEPNIPETPEDIDALERDDVIALLKGHGVEKPKGKIGNLKADLKKIMFTSL